MTFITVTATGIAPIEFSREVFRGLDISSDEVLEAWVQLYLTRNPKYYVEVMKAKV